MDEEIMKPLFPALVSFSALASAGFSAPSSFLASPSVVVVVVVEESSFSLSPSAPLASTSFFSSAESLQPGAVGLDPVHPVGAFLEGQGVGAGVEVGVGVGVPGQGGLTLLGFLLHEDPEQPPPPVAGTGATGITAGFLLSLQDFPVQTGAVGFSQGFLVGTGAGAGTGAHAEPDDPQLEGIAEADTATKEIKTNKKRRR